MLKVASIVNFLFVISTKIDYFSGESKQLADPDVLKRLTSSVRFVSFSQVWTSTAVVLSVKCPHKISYRRHFYLQFWDNNWCPSSTYWLFPENLAQLSCFFCCSFLFDINALQLCPGRGGGGSDPHALRACCATAWHRQVNKQINKTSGNFSLNDQLASVVGLSQLVNFRSLVAACSQGDIGRVRRLLDEVAKVFSDWDALLQLLVIISFAPHASNYNCKSGPRLCARDNRGRRIPFESCL